MDVTVEHHASCLYPNGVMAFSPGLARNAGLPWENFVVAAVCDRRASFGFPRSDGGRRPPLQAFAEISVGVTTSWPIHRLDGFPNAATVSPSPGGEGPDEGGRYHILFPSAAQGRVAIVYFEPPHVGCYLVIPLPVWIWTMIYVGEGCPREARAERGVHAASASKRKADWPMLALDRLGHW